MVKLIPGGKPSVRVDLPLDLLHRHSTLRHGMKNPFSHEEKYLEQLKSIEQKISQTQLREAAQQLNLLVKTDAHDPRLFLLGSRLAEAAGNPDGTLQAARKAHQLAPGWPVATIHLAGVLANRGETEEAMSVAEQATRQAVSGAADRVELLVKAAAVARGLNHYPQALQWLREANSISPDDLSIRHQIARILIEAGDAAQAMGILTDLLQQMPNSPTLLRDRLRACLSTAQTGQALQDGEALLALDPDNEVYRFYLDIARGETPKTQPSLLVSELFDDVAARYDRYWTGQLRYQLPHDVAQMIKQWHPDRKGDVLDLGCGTGLLGVSLGPMEGVLVGVDLSARMLEQAGRHRLYDGFHQVNLLDALLATPENLYHVIAALDVFTYVGCLDVVIPNAYHILLPGARLVFSCETGAEGAADYTLPSSYRYTHQRSYVQRLLRAAGFQDIVLEDRVLRQEADQPVPGFLVVARKPAPKIGKRESRRK